MLAEFMQAYPSSFASLPGFKKSNISYENLTWLFLCLFAKCTRIGDNSKCKVISRIFSDLNLEEKLTLPMRIQLCK